jgi:hypothetical protein
VRLMKRVADLEQRLSPPPPKGWVRMMRCEDQPEEKAIAAWTAEHESLGDRNVIMRVIVG